MKNLKQNSAAQNFVLLAKQNAQQRIAARLTTLAKKHNYTLTEAEIAGCLNALAEAAFDVLLEDVSVQQLRSLTDAHLTYEIAVCKQDTTLQDSLQS